MDKPCASPVLGPGNLYWFRYVGEPQVYAVADVALFDKDVKFGARPCNRHEGWWVVQFAGRQGLSQVYSIPASTMSSVLEQAFPIRMRFAVDKSRR